MPQAFYGHKEYTKPSLALTCHRCQINNRGQVDVKATRISRYQFRRTYMHAYYSHLHRVGVNGAVVHYDKDVFGPNADSFNPDRWIEGYDARLDKTMIQFGAGPRTCYWQERECCLVHLDFRM